MKEWQRYFHAFDTGAGRRAFQCSRYRTDDDGLDAGAFRCEKPVIHISLNPDIKDALSDTRLSEIAGLYMERMGWGDQPYIVFKHMDIEREHIHIVSLQVDTTGKR